MRLIQSAALFGLVMGSAMMLYGMIQGLMAITIIGAALGVLVGVPAAYLWYGMQGIYFDPKKFRLRRIDQAQPSTPAVTTPQRTSQEIPIRIVSDKKPVTPIIEAAKPATKEVLQIPITKEPHAPQPVEIQKPKITPEERQKVIDEIEAGKTLEIVTKFASHEDALIRLYAVQRLGNMGDPLAEKALRKALDDQEDIVRRAARMALNKLGLATH